MATNLHSPEPFPKFVDCKRPSPYDQFSSMGVVELLNASSTAQLRRQHATLLHKFTNYFELIYYRYELTIGAYLWDPMEKVIVNTLVLAIFTALMYGLFVGFQPFVVRSICHLIYYINGSLSGVEDICSGATCT